MEYQASIYCSPEVKNQILDDSILESFWTIQFDKPKEADLMLDFMAGQIKVQGLKQSFNLDMNLGALMNEISPLDLGYIDDLFEGKSERAEMLELVRKELAINLDELIQSIADQDTIRINQCAHKLHSKLHVLRIPVSDACRFIEQNSKDYYTSLFKEKYNLLKMFCLIRLWQIS